MSIMGFNIWSEFNKIRGFSMFACRAGLTQRLILVNDDFLGYGGLNDTVLARICESL